MKITILKTHQSNGTWCHSGVTVEENDMRAQELIHAGLAVAAAGDSDEPKEVKAARNAHNKAAPTAKHK